MARRMIDTGFFKDPFVRGLQGAYKGLYIYLFLDCSSGGIWNVELDVAKIRCGISPDVDDNEILELFKDKIILLDGGQKWFLKNFLKTQQGGVLSPKNVALKNAIIELLKYDLIEKNEEGNYVQKQAPIKPLQRGIQRGTSNSNSISNSKSNSIVKEKNKKKESDFFENSIRLDVFSQLYTDLIKKYNPDFHYMPAKHNGDFEGIFNSVIHVVKSRSLVSGEKLTMDKIIEFIELCFEHCGDFHKGKVLSPRHFNNNFDTIIVAVKSPKNSKEAKEKKRLSDIEKLKYQVANE